MELATQLDLKIRGFESVDDDGPAIAHIFNAELKADGVPGFESEDGIKAWLRHPTDAFDPARDMDIAEVDGKPVAYAEREWIDTTDGKYREYRINGAVLPEYRGRGIGATLLALNERRSRELAASQPATERQLIFGSWSSDRQTARIALLEKNGYERVRYFFDMIRPLSDAIPDLPLPDGLEIRPTTMDNIRQIWKADSEAFQDHWGGFDQSEERLKSWMESPEFDMSMWLIAWDGDEVAGGVINGINVAENNAIGVQRGWLHSVFTRRAWRKRGLANALIARSLTLIKERGMDFGVLGVDADNPTGALGLYERNGFKVLERSTAWRKRF